MDRKTAILLVGGVAAILLLRFVVLGDHGSSAGVVAAAESVPLAEARLKRLREVSATLPAREQQFKQATDELQLREKGMLKADTGSQAQAFLQEKLRRLGQANGIDIRGMEDARIRPMGNDYGEAMVYVRFSCGIEQLVNLLAQIGNEPELLATNQIQITGSTAKEKVLQVRLGLSGVVSKKIAQEKKVGGGL
ncbi:MAG TPA: type II secretion system protein GspM [Candidatus Acidoferrum sp.]|nr:type II secretion system protein GspM [Candidatus Acidoferrum sp.]